MSSILILGDPHLGKGGSLAKQSVGSIFNSRVIDQVKLLNWVYDQAVGNNVNHIIITGDVFEDPKPHYSLVGLFIDWLKTCIDEKIQVHIIAGNHDILRSGQFTTSPLDIISSEDLENVFIYKRTTTLHLSDVGVTFLPFRDRRSFNTDINSDAICAIQAQLPYEVSSIDDTSIKILVGHLALEGSIPVGYELDDLANELFCPLNMFKRYDYVWMGHVHKFQIMSESPHIAHIGSMDISDFGETEHEKYICILNAKEKNKLNYIKIPTRKLNHITVNIPENIENITQFILDRVSEYSNIDNSILKLSISLPGIGSYSIDRNKIEKELYKIGVFHIARISEERKFVSLKKQITVAMDNTVNEISAIKTYSSLIEENLREDFINTASDIIREYKEGIK